ncbi:cyclic AMP-dependent transcription factor ATF-3-like [Ylistrum balloti]|uniref:cyclic AMP-dependent transcription factor ATF-3-like n=1 Tax=Ylistrum balloti TaxID=509963 RepID=UPI0029059011|nr:cyclic AMP-dependent transcription factor ATF-3-like [Ylistrum balloti]
MPPSAIYTIHPNTIPSDNQGFLNNVQEEFDLTRAYIQSAEMGTVTPLLKQELRFKIQARRLSEGRAELSVTETNKNPEEDKLTIEDIKKRRQRQKQNAESSQRARRREMLREDVLWKRINVFSAANNRLRRTRDALQQEKEDIMNKLQNIGCIHETISECPTSNRNLHIKVVSPRTRTPTICVLESSQTSSSEKKLVSPPHTSLNKSVISSQQTGSTIKQVELTPSTGSPKERVAFINRKLKKKSDAAFTNREVQTNE